MSEHETSFDWIVEKYLGSTGRWQRLQLVITLMATISTSFPLYLHLFSAYVPPHRCLIPICDSEQSGYNESFVTFAIPEEKVRDDFLGVSEAFSQCSMHVIAPSKNSRSCLASSFSTENTEVCHHGYVYSQSLFPSSFATETNLVCENKSLSQLISSMIPFGITVGSILCGPIMDRLGRRLPIITASIVSSISLGVSGAIVNYSVFLVCRFLLAASAAVIWLSNRSLQLELFGAKHRSRALFIDSGLFQVFAPLAALMAYFIRDWQLLHYISSFLAAIPAVIATPFLYESIRWQAFNGDEQGVVQVVKHVVETNGGSITTNDEIAIMDHLTKLKLRARSTSKSSQMANFLQLFHGQLALRLVLTTFMGIVGSVTQYSLTFGSVTSLSGNIFLNFSLTFVASLIPYIILFIFSPARKPTLFSILLLMGVCSCVNAFVDKNQSSVVLVLMLLTRLTANTVLNFGAMYAFELFPTVVRGKAVGFMSGMSKLIASGAPFLENLSDIWQPLPLLLIGITAFLSGTLLLLLPETNNQCLSDMFPVESFNQERTKCFKKGPQVEEEMKMMSSKSV